jgi:hypothetical protein
MTPQQAPLNIYRGDTGHWTFTFWVDQGATVPYDLAGAVPKAEVRARPDTAVLSTLGCVVTQPNIVDVTLPAAESALLISGTAKWDLQVTFPDTTVRTLVAGPVTITADITESGMLPR